MTHIEKLICIFDLNTRNLDFFLLKIPKINQKRVDLRLENLVLVRSRYFAVNRGWQFGGRVGSRKSNHST